MLLGLRLIGSSLLVLWVVDVLLNLALLERVLLARQLLGRFQDYLGLLIADGQVALLVAALSWAGSLLITTILGNRDRTKEAVASCSALLSTLTLLAGTKAAWYESLPLPWPLLAIALPTWLLSWLLLRLALNRRREAPSRFIQMTPYVLFPALILGFTHACLTRATRGAWGPAATSLLLAVLSVGLALPLLWKRAPRWSLATPWLPTSCALLLAASSCLGNSLYGEREEARLGRETMTRPDIVLIILDTVRADHLETYGYRRNTMPALLRWSADALAAKRAISPSGWTKPSHASIFSGRTVSGHGIHYAPRSGALHTGAFPGISWLPEKLAAEGYYCLAVTANRWAIPAGGIGFHRILWPPRLVWGNDSTIGGIADSLLPMPTRLSGRLRWRMPYVDAKGITDIAMRAVPEGEAPLFLFVNFMDAHSPYNPPAHALDLLGARAPSTLDPYQSHRELSRRWSHLPEGKEQDLVNLYDGELRWLDTQLHRLLRWIDRRFGKDTVVIISSDHGEELGEEGRVGHEYGLSQALLHVPLLLRSPELEPGSLETMVNLRNLFGFIHRAGLGEKPGLEELVRPDEFGIIAERYPSAYNAATLGGEYGRTWVSVFQGRHKAVGPSRNGLELYDIEADGFDREVPVSDPLAEASLGARIDDYWIRHRDTRGGAHAFELPTGEELERLKSLGYVK